MLSSLGAVSHMQTNSTIERQAGGTDDNLFEADSLCDCLRRASRQNDEKRQGKYESAKVYRLMVVTVLRWRQ